MKQILLHCCCAPCASAVIEWMLDNGIRPTLFYCNPNIFPYEEYTMRKDELSRYAGQLGLEVIDDDYNHEDWLRQICGMEDEPERGSRCLQCFKIRLLRAAQAAKMCGMKYFATTLASSRWKSIEQIEDAGTWAAAMVEDTEFVARNWRKGGLQQRRNELLKQNGFYNQQYCGCEFSMRVMQGRKDNPTRQDTLG